MINHSASVSQHDLASILSEILQTSSAAQNGSELCTVQDFYQPLARDSCKKMSFNI